MRPVVPLHRAQLAANEVCGLELGRVQGPGTFPWASSRLGTVDGRHILSCVGTAISQQDGSSVFLFCLLGVELKTVHSKHPLCAILPALL